MYRLQTERKNVAGIQEILLKFGLDYTIQFCEGSFQLCREKSMTIELEGVSRWVARRVALAIKKLNGQESVLVQKIVTTKEFV
jgi:hypothetical protein